MLLCGIACDAIGLLLLSIAVEQWVPFALLPLFALGGKPVLPALQAMMSRGISDERQGELQGLLSSFNSLGAIIGPVLVTSLYFMTQASAPGMVWALAAILYVITLPLLLKYRLNKYSGVP